MSKNSTNRPKIKRRSKSATTVFVENSAYKSGFKNPMSWSVGGSW